VKVDPIHVLAELLAATPEPPGPDTDATTILEGAEAMAQARQALITSLGELRVGPAVAPPLCQSVLEELRGREARWTALLVHARWTLNQQAAASRRRRREAESGLAAGFAQAGGDAGGDAP
jgi:hypothetical protein